jgi:uncharacterized protein YggE
MRDRSIVMATTLTLFCGAASAQDSGQFILPHISVTGSSFVGIRPDIATLPLGVISEKPTVAEAESVLRLAISTP